MTASRWSVTTDSDPFQLLTEAFQAEYRVSLSPERPDGSVVLALSNERGAAAKCLIRPAQLHDLEQLQWMIESTRFDITIESGASVSQLLRAITQDRARWPIAI